MGNLLKLLKVIDLKEKKKGYWFNFKRKDEFRWKEEIVNLSGENGKKELEYKLMLFFFLIYIYWYFFFNWLVVFIVYIGYK